MVFNILLAIILLLIVIPGTFIFLLSIIWTFTSFRPMKWLCHDFAGWHEPDPDKEIEFDGCNHITYCKICGKRIMQDSQGNWF